METVLLIEGCRDGSGEGEVTEFCFDVTKYKKSLFLSFNIKAKYFFSFCQVNKQNIEGKKL